MTYSPLARQHYTGLAALLVWACLPSTISLGQAQRGAQQQPQRQTLQQRQERQQRQAQLTPQQRERQQQQPAAQSIRTGDGMLAIQAKLPEEVHTGEQFTYDVTVQNTTDNITLHDIKLRHTEANGLTIESISRPGEEQRQQEGRQQRTQQARDGQQRQQADQQQDFQQREDQQQNQQQDQQQGQQQRDAQQRQRQAQPAADQRQQNQQRQQAGQQRQQAGQQQDQADQQQDFQQREDQQQNQRQDQQPRDDDRTLSIDQLGPGESRTFTVNASVDQEGPVDACLVVMSYRPAICLQTKAVKPELNIVKTAPERSHLCDVIELTYTVQNDGTGAVGEFEIVDELAEGLRTIDGQERLAFTVDQLEAGDTRQFVARVYATRTGQFPSRAQARAIETQLRSRSENIGPEVVGADLQVSLDGRGTVASNTPAMFAATVTNTGNAAVEDVQVIVRFPEQANLRQISDPQIGRRDQQAAGQRNQQSANRYEARFDGQREERFTDQQAPAEPDQQAAGQRRAEVTDQQVQQQGQQQGQQVRDQQVRDQQVRDRGDRQAARQRDRQAATGRNQQRATDQPVDQQFDSAAVREERFTLGRLEPGQTAQFDYVLTARGMDEIATQVEAMYVCQIDAAEDDAEVRKSSQAMAATRVIRLPALQVYALDDVDPVGTDQQVTYTIRVKNEGDANDQNVQVTATLPDQLAFEDAEGPTQFQQQDQQIVFEPLEQLAPGEEAEYLVTATAVQKGNVRLEVEVDSQSLSSAVRVAEPTQLFDSQASN